MTNSIKVYEELSIIHLKDWDTVLTELKTAEIASLMAKSEFIYVWDEIINKFEIKRVKKFKPTDIDNYIWSRPKIERERLNEIVKNRNSKWFQTKDVPHLVRIYNSKYGDNTSNSEESTIKE